MEMYYIVFDHEREREREREREGERERNPHKYLCSEPPA